ncbi:MAG: TrbG/VirB9 family P-type conjugative transfer protein [Synergistaceae bacterium]|nr:TrbG/VirB9 family P-type conjugative transfer protein [Synergistaceae bacterium]
MSLPSRFADSDVTYAAGPPRRAEISPAPLPLPQTSDGGRRQFMFGSMRPQIVCRVNMTTRIDLEPGERVENYHLSDGQRWSISAAWSGPVDSLVTHVLLRTFFPGVRSSLTIRTDRRIYEMDLISGTDVQHMAHIGFRYPVTPGSPAEAQAKADAVPPGRYRDLLAQYGIIEGAPSESTREVRRVDGAELNFRYRIRPLGKKKPLWTPSSVYDADGRTYIVMPRSRPNRAGTGGTSRPIRPALYTVNRGVRTIAKTTALRSDLYVTDREFDEAILKWGGDEVSITRIRPAD